ncbi:MAG: exported protein of unknown function [Candidatus Saccharibacteria bacterium]|nr:exported protein of unknown function [Candidatus Saccharibacteria bacterium]
MLQAAITKVRANYLTLAAAILVAVITWALLAHSVAGMNYSAGTYGSCQYGSCGISLTTSGSLSADVTPAVGSTRCTVNNDIVTVATNASTGYTVTLTDTDTTNTLVGPTTIAASSATPASPAVLTANTWGYRVDSIAGFGAGPTSSVSSGAIPSETYAGVPISSGTPGTIRTTSVADTGAVNTSVWYGVCAGSSLPSGSYTDNVTYTAVIN